MGYKRIFLWLCGILLYAIAAAAPAKECIAVVIAKGTPIQHYKQEYKYQ